MPASVRSYAKINLGLAIGPPRSDGFHSLLTLYQTLALHDRVILSAQPAAATSIEIHCNDPRVPRDSRNTVWKIVVAALDHLRIHAQVSIQIEKRLPVQGGMGAGSANAAAALLALERELSRNRELSRDEGSTTDQVLPAQDRLRIAALVGSDVPLFLLGGAVLGTGRGEQVQPLPDLALAGRTAIDCVVALPRVSVSTPAAFRRWDEQWAGSSAGGGLRNTPRQDTIELLSRTYVSVFPQEALSGEADDAGSGASGILSDPGSSSINLECKPDQTWDSPEKLHGLSREQHHTSSLVEAQSGIANDLAGNSLLALVHTGIQNDFEQVVFAEHPSLRVIKRQLMGPPGNGNEAIYASLSGSGSALFGLYRSRADAQAAQQRVQQHGVRAVVTSTLPRQSYWSGMFA